MVARQQRGHRRVDRLVALDEQRTQLVPQRKELRVEARRQTESLPS